MMSKIELFLQQLDYKSFYLKVEKIDERIFDNSFRYLAYKKDFYIFPRKTYALRFYRHPKKNRFQLLLPSVEYWKSQNMEIRTESLIGRGRYRLNFENRKEMFLMQKEILKAMQYLVEKSECFKDEFTKPIKIENILNQDKKGIFLSKDNLFRGEKCILEISEKIGALKQHFTLYTLNKEKIFSAIDKESFCFKNTEWFRKSLIKETEPGRFIIN